MLVLAALAHFLARDRATLAHVVDGDVPRHAQDPRGERNLAGLVLVEVGQQLREHVLRDVLCLVVVAQQAGHVAVDVVGVTDVEKAQRLLVALLGAGHRACNEAARLGVVVKAGRAPEMTFEHARARALLGSCVLLGLVDEPQVRR